MNGLKTCSYEDHGSMYHSSANLNIGGMWHWSGCSFKGLIDEVKLSTEARYSENFDPDASQEPVTPIATKKISPSYYFHPSNLLD